MYSFNSQIKIGNSFESQSIEAIKNEPMLFSCDIELYSGYNLAKALKHCEIDNEKNRNS